MPQPACQTALRIKLAKRLTFELPRRLRSICWVDGILSHVRIRDRAWPIIFPVRNRPPRGLRTIRLRSSGGPRKRERSCWSSVDLSGHRVQRASYNPKLWMKRKGDVPFRGCCGVNPGPPVPSGRKVRDPCWSLSLDGRRRRRRRRTGARWMSWPGRGPADDRGRPAARGRGVRQPASGRARCGRPRRGRAQWDRPPADRHDGRRSDSGGSAPRE